MQSPLAVAAGVADAPSAAPPAGADACAPCGRCARQQKTCCQRAEVLLTLSDVQRIAARTGRADFFEHRAPRAASYLERDPDDPRWLELTTRADGRRRMLLRRADGDCHFLGPSGCTLETGVRPLVCRLYPFTFTEVRVTGIDPEDCPTALLAPHGESMDQVLHMTIAEAEPWRAQLYRELQDGHA